MSGLFENLSLDDSTQRVAGRQAAAVAVKRAQDRFRGFLARASSVQEREARLALIDSDLMTIVATVAAEYDADAMRLDKIVRDALTGRDRVAKFVEARRPKMCPYHREVMDISLASGEPTAGFNSMAQHAWGKNHCQGEFEGGCNFRREMVTQDYWDKKAEEADQRRQERDQIDVQNGVGADLPETVLTPEEPVQEPVVEEPIVEPVEEPEDTFAGDFSMAASTKMAEALKTVDVTKGGETPSPKMDKRKWTEENVGPLETEGEGSPHPTQKQKIDKKPKLDKADFKDQTDAVTESEDLPSNDGDAGFNKGGEKGKGGTWKENNGADPVTSSSHLDVDKNPLREILEQDFGGFVPTSVAQNAITAHVRKEAYGEIGPDDGYADSGGYLADPMGRPGQPEWDDPNGPYYDPPCPKCGAREGAFEGEQQCMACGYTDPLAGKIPTMGPDEMVATNPNNAYHPEEIQGARDALSSVQAGMPPYGSPEHDAMFGNQPPGTPPTHIPHDPFADQDYINNELDGRDYGGEDPYCPNCGGLEPGQASGAGDICTCPPAAPATPMPPPPAMGQDDIPF